MHNNKRSGQARSWASQQQPVPHLLHLLHAA